MENETNDADWLSPLSSVFSDKDAGEALAVWLCGKEPFASKLFRDFVPPSALQIIGRLTDDLSLGWPWPYSREELATILETLPEDTRETGGQKLVRTARTHLAKVWWRKRGPKRKTNPIEELWALKAAANALLTAIDALSDEAEIELLKRRYLVPLGAPDANLLRHTVDAFLPLLRALPEPEPIDRRGRKVEIIGREFHDRLEMIYVDAFGGKRPKRGFPSFQHAVIEPLKKWGGSSIEGKSLQDRRRSPDRSTRQRRIKQQKTDF